MKIAILAVAVLSGTIGTCSAEAVAMVDGVIKFAVGVPSAPATPPTEIEMNVSTCVLAFTNFHEYRSIVLGDKDVLEDKIRELRKAIDDRSDLPVARTRPFLARINWLKQYYQSLP